MDIYFMRKRCVLALSGLEIVRDIEPTIYRYFPLKMRALKKHMMQELRNYQVKPELDVFDSIFGDA
jgi:hypothetical protein